MRIIKLFVLAIFIFGLLQVSLLSEISSRIEGIVTDKDTGEPIEGVEARLIYDAYETKIRTDKKGYFKFDAPLVNEYYDIQCKKKGYIAS